MLTSVSLGYALSMLFLLLNFREVKLHSQVVLFFILSLALTMCVLGFELSSIYQAASGSFAGKYIRIGVIIFLLNLIISVDIYGKAPLRTADST